MKRAAKFVIAFFLLTVAMTVAWDFIFPGRIYYCTDEVGFDFLSPGNWVHGTLESVSDVREASDRDMGQPDIIAEGWSVSKLWLTWAAMMGASVLISYALTRVRWISSVAVVAPDY